MLLGRLAAPLCAALLCLGATAQELEGEPGAAAASGKLGAASHGDAGDQTWTVRLGFYDRDDASGAEGNPFLDESLTIVEPVFLYDHQVSEDFGYSAKLSYDMVSSASIERLGEVAAQSGASRDNYINLDLGFRHRLSATDDLSWHLDLATEYDYTSFGLGGGWTHTFQERDASLSLNLNLYEDLIDPILFDGTELKEENRTSLAATFGWYQVIGPRTHGEFGLTLSDQSGFLETPYNAVVQEDPSYAANPNLANNAQGLEFTEQLPDGRMRTTLFGKVRHGLGDSDAIELGARLYDDDWGVAGWDLTPRWLHEFDSGLLMDLSYRYYTQDASEHWAEHFTGTGPMPTFRTQDSDLGEFDSSLLGSHWRWGHERQWDFGLNFLSRSDGLDHLFFSFGWTTSY